MQDLKVASGRANLPLAEKIAEYLGITLTPTSIRNFSDGEIWVKYEENIRGIDLFIRTISCFGKNCSCQS